MSGAAARTVWFTFHLGCHQSALSLSALKASPLIQTVALMWGSDPCFSSPQPPRADPVLLTLLFFPLGPSFSRALRGSVYSFLLVRYSCHLSADVQHALLCLKVYSWCICGERCTPHPLTLLPSFPPSLTWISCRQGIIGLVLIESVNVNLYLVHLDHWGSKWLLL